LAGANPEAAVAAATTGWAEAEEAALKPLSAVARPGDYSRQVLGFLHSQSRRKQRKHKSGLK